MGGIRHPLHGVRASLGRLIGGVGSNQRGSVHQQLDRLGPVVREPVLCPGRNTVGVAGLGVDLLVAQGKLPGAFRHEECQIFLGRRGHGELPAWVHFHHPHAANEVVQEDPGVLGEHRSAGRPRSISAGASPRDFIRVDVSGWYLGERAAHAYG